MDPTDPTHLIDPMGPSSPGPVSPETVWLPASGTSIPADIVPPILVAQTKVETSTTESPLHLQDALIKDQASWTKFLKRHELELLWDTTETTEQEKYARITENMERADRKHRHKVDQLIQINNRWLKEQRKGFKPHSTYERTVGYVMQVAELVETKLQDKRLAADEVSGRLSVSQHTTAQEQDRLQSVDLRDANYTNGVFRAQVLQRLQGTRYYFGHAGGDYIFRYKVALYDIIGIPKRDLGTLEFSSNLWFNSDFDIAVPEDAHECLVYAGQVPRPLKQYVQRMSAILPGVVRMLLTILAFDSENERQHFRQVYGDHFDKPLKLTSESIRQLYNTWRERYPAEDSIPEFLAKETASHPRILEFIHLFSKCYAVSQSNALLENKALLVRLVEHAARKSLWELTDAAVVHEEYRARDLLLRDKTTRHVLIFEDEFESDIHSSYNTTSYHSDPFHHLNQYDHDSWDKVNLALKEFRKLRKIDITRCPCANSSAALSGTQPCDQPGCNNSGSAPISRNSLSSPPARRAWDKRRVRASRSPRESR